MKKGGLKNGTFLYYNSFLKNTVQLYQVEVLFFKNSTVLEYKTTAVLTQTICGKCNDFQICANSALSRIRLRRTSLTWVTAQAALYASR